MHTQQTDTEQTLALRFSANPSSDSALHRHLYHNGSNGSMSVALRLQFQSHPRCNLTTRKSGIYTKQCLFFSFDTKFIYYIPLLLDADKRETVYENKSTALDRQKQTNCYKMIEARRDSNIILLSRCGTLSLCLHKMGAVIFCSSSHHSA